MYTKTRTNLYRTTYHLVWVTKYRKVIFTTLNRREVMEDHIHLVVSFPPNKSISTVMKALMLTSSRNRHFLPISFPQILPDKIRHFLSNQKLFVDVSFDNSRRPFEPILLGGEGGRGLLLRPLHRLRVHPTDPGSYLKSV